ncbi:hypothetical protein LAV84_18450 [Rhizobium sp. VS19-DR104.2]|nr:MULTISPECIES: hypothetical protein [unclassified Rhizobium]MBZ5761552.1 hypothetical protein [Rhizobium sp. VS19-DR96]MBZ5767500.1 hypothetical protein [Rhizobium sp. VS19-DR129.2]MBZ5775051.1 hypothetical protein [Rhizobium sp. VS19-DRK62.2]MBZ5785984.1 hypothetical protein [Rhizobium sp. VS19-DR121]MBZ5803410.1 hypothetical protein [Rhizobium sp. VS19-DR181]
MNIAAALVVAGLGFFAFAKWMDRFVVIQDERETGPYFDNVIQFPIRRRS